jgi:hypothetical protein
VLANVKGRSVAIGRRISQLRQSSPTLNATFLTLIPKEERVTNPKNFRPIALCNVIYKIISKVIALRLKPILPFIISKEKSGTSKEGKSWTASFLFTRSSIRSKELALQVCY